MRNAAANFDDDFGYDEPRRQSPRKPRPTAGRSKPRKKKGKRFGMDLHKVARYAAIGMGATVALGIMVNALVMQKGHHPAPLFGKAIILSETRPIERATAPTPVGTTPATTASATGQSASIAPPPMPVTKPRHPASPTAADKESSDDAIAKLLRGEAPVQIGADRSEAKTVLGAQKALAKLGFTLKPSGSMSPATRKAIEAFEKERNLPIKGELSRRLVKILSAESGIKID